METPPALKAISLPEALEMKMKRDDWAKWLY